MRGTWEKAQRVSSLPAKLKGGHERVNGARCACVRGGEGEGWRSDPAGLAGVHSRRETIREEGGTTRNSPGIKPNSLHRDRRREEEV